MRKEAEPRPILCYVTDRHGLAPGAGASAGDLLVSVRRAIAAGMDWIQIREKDLPARELLGLIRQAVAAAAGTSTKILVNDRLDVALAASAAGVHLGGESLPLVEVARWRGAGHAAQKFLIGASCHTRAEVQAAEREGADYVFFGPVFATPSKLTFGPPQGIERLAEVCRSVRIPVLAIGGITIETAGDCLRARAAGIAAIRLFQQPAELNAILASLRSVA